MLLPQGVLLVMGGRAAAPDLGGGTEAPLAPASGEGGMACRSAAGAFARHRCAKRRVFMQQRGWQVEGVELDQAVPNPGRMPIRYGDFLRMDFARNAYDAITLWAVLEHV